MVVTSGQLWSGNAVLKVLSKVQEKVRLLFRVHIIEATQKTFDDFAGGRY